MLLQALNLQVHYPGSRGKILRAVNGVDLEIRSGETLSLVGESGCGKSSLGRALLRLEPLAGGRLIAFGEEISHRPERQLKELRKRSALIFQDPYASLNPRMSLNAALLEPLQIHRWGTRNQRRARVKHLLERVGLSPEQGDRRPHSFSGGQLQRACIARALALNPELLVADEALSALDVSVQAGILKLLKALQEERNLAYLFIAHDLTVVRHISHRVAVMYLGRIVEEAPCAQLFSDPRHPYTQALLAAVPRPDPQHSSKPLTLVGEAPSPLDLPPGCSFAPRCPRALPRCREGCPSLKADGSHKTACYLC